MQGGGGVGVSRINMKDEGDDCMMRQVGREL